MLIFAGFLMLASRAFAVLAMGVSDSFAAPGSGGLYDTVRDWASTVVLLSHGVAIVRRLVFAPARYGRRSADADFPARPDRPADGRRWRVRRQRGCHAQRAFWPPWSLPWMCQAALAGGAPATLHQLHLGAYLTHECAFFFLLCYRPFGIQFHVETSLFSIYFAKLDRGTVKPVRWGVPDDQLDRWPPSASRRSRISPGSTSWTSTPARTAAAAPSSVRRTPCGRPLSPRAFSIKTRDYLFQHYPVLGPSGNGMPLVGALYSEDEIWSCTTCGACEAECPLLVEYIDKIVDLTAWPG